MLPYSVGVIIPFNQTHIRDLKEAVLSVLRQTIPPQSVLIVDNSNGHIASAYEWRKVSKTIKVVKLEANVGASHARNHGAQLLDDHTYVAFLDSDDCWMPEKLETQLKRMVATNSSASTCGFAFKKGVRLLRRPVGLNKLCGSSPYLRSHLGLGSVLVIRTSDFRKIMGFDPNLKRFEDWDFHIRLEMFQLSLLKVDSTLVVVNRVPNANWNNARDALVVLEKKYLEASQKHLSELKSGILFEKAVISFRKKSPMGGCAFLVRSFLLDIRQLNYLLLVIVQHLKNLR